MQRNEPLPLGIDLSPFWQHVKRALHAGYNPFNVTRKQPKTVPVERTRRDAPTFDDVLRHDANAIAASFENLQCRACFLMLCIISVDASYRQSRSTHSFVMAALSAQV